LFKGEKSIFNIVRAEEKLFAVGRLDKNSRGLVLLTNDGDWANKLTHPRYEHEKEYEVIIGKSKTRREKKDELFFNNVINKLERGVDIGEGDGFARARRVKYLGQEKFRVILTEGKKRQIRRMFKALGLRVEDLLRVRIGNIKLDKLKEGNWVYLENKE
jgi:pseudouridine synthase